MDIALIGSALLLGLTTSLHCVGMCGPIAFSLGLGGTNNNRFFTKNLTYQFGRVTTYTTLGVLFSLIGTGLSLSGGQNFLSIFAGVVMILMAILPKNIANQNLGKGTISKILFQLKQKLGQYIQRKSYTSLYVTGLLNGLLPCGAVYAAIIAAVGVGKVASGTLFMFLFGLGTIPLMYATVVSGQFLTVKMRNRIVKILPIITIVLGVLFILRGFGINPLMFGMGCTHCTDGTCTCS